MPKKALRRSNTKAIAKGSDGLMQAAEADGRMQIAKFEASFGKARIKSRVAVTPEGLLAIGGLVSGILLSTSLLVWVSTSVARRRADS